MISTFANVRDRALGRLDDPNQATFTDAILLPGIGEAVDALFGAFVFFEIPRSKVVATYTLPAYITSLTPADMGIADMGEIIELRERRFGSTDKYVHVTEVDDLSQRGASGILGEWEWRGDALWFIGATQSRQLWISYFSTTGQPSTISGSTGVDGALTFLSLYTVGAVGGRKGYNEIANECRQIAVGNHYNDGVIGGELFRLCQPMVRARQRVPVAPQPFSVIRRRSMFARMPYIAAQTPAGVGMGPTQFSSSLGTITGTIDGTNTTFYLPYPVSSVSVYLNGVALTAVMHYVFAANQIVFIAPYIPQPGADIMAEAWI